VIGSELAGIPELIEHQVTGLLFPAGDAPALAQAMDSLYRDPSLRRHMGWAGRRRVEAGYDVEIHNQRILDIYQALLDPDSGPLGGNW
jgi:glycosyltransferase involved in cell wall biosynthesis